MFSTIQLLRLSINRVCEPSERETWTTSGQFKVGDADHQPQEQRDNCPGKTPDTENRKPLYEGKLDFVREHLCLLFNHDLPTGETLNRIS